MTTSVDVGANLVTNGYAWVYRKYARDPDLYDYEKIAKSKKLGIWALPKDQQIPPWEWRKKKGLLAILLQKLSIKHVVQKGIVVK